MMKTLFLVEDNPDNADLIKDLVGESYILISCSDPHEALVILQDKAGPPPDLMLLDISLPGMDGVSLLKNLRSLEHLSQTPAIALTAHAMKDDEAKLLAAGFDGYMSKPIVDEDRFFALIEEQIVS